MDGNEALDRSTPLSDARFQRAASMIQSADALIVAAGAGMGVDSGLPDFRGVHGFWKAYPALKKANLDFTEVANPAAFRRDPALAWGFYGHRLTLYRETMPHEGFSILRRWGIMKPLGAWIFTSNVDGQFQKAGFSEERLLEIHGSIHHLQCLVPCSERLWSSDALTPRLDIKECRMLGTLPTCPQCHGLARPNILMFGESTGSWVAQRTLAQIRAFRQWLASVRSPVVVEVGAGSAVMTVRNFSTEMVRELGAGLIRINPDDPEGADISLDCGGYQGLSGIDRLLNS